MLTSKKVAVTGIPSSGKSSVCNFFDKLGAQVESADTIVHAMLMKKHPVGQKVIALLGSDIIKGEQLDRVKIAARVFTEPLLLRALEAIIHPEVIKELERRYLEVSKQAKPPLFVAELPLLFEAGMDDAFDVIIAVVADLDECKRRYMAQRACGAKEFTQRLAQQWDQEKKAKNADYVLTNMGEPSELKKAVKELFIELTVDKPSIQESSTSHESEK